MKKILIPTAYTMHSKVAFRYAQKLAQYFEASITLVHIYESPSSSLITNAGLMKDDLKQFAEQRWEDQMQKLKAFAAEMSAKQFHGTQLDFIATDGSVVDQLLNIQQENDFDLIVMGMRKHNLLDRVFGNTTYTIIDEVSCPLLLVPPGAHFMNIDKILYGTTFKVGDDQTVDKLLDWCLAFSATLDILHVHQKEDAKKAGKKMAELMEGFHREKEAGVINTQLREGTISKILEQYIKTTGTDLLAVHRRKQGLLQEMTDGSLTKLLSEEIQIPLLVLKS